MGDDAVGDENDMLDFDDSMSEETTPTHYLTGKGSLSDVEIDYETRSEISGDDDNAEDAGASTSSLSKEDMKYGDDISKSSKDVETTMNPTSKRKSNRPEESKDVNSSNKRLKTTEQKSTKSDEDDPMMKSLLKDARFFLMKTSDANNLKVSQEKKVWFTDPQNVTILDSAVEASKNVVLIFSAKWTGRFSGFALVTSRSKSDDPPRDWAPSVKTLGGLFHVKWLSRKELLFSFSSHLTNPSTGKLLSLFVDGQEIDQKLGLELCHLLLQKGIEPKVSVEQHKNELSIKFQQETDESSCKKLSKTPIRTLNGRKDGSSNKKNSYSGERSDSRHTISLERSRIRNRSSNRTYSSAQDSNRISRKSREYNSFTSRRRSAVRGDHSSDRRIPSSAESSGTRERYHSRDTRRESSLHDLRYKTSRGQYRIHDSVNKTNYRNESLNELHVRETYLNDDSCSREPSLSRSRKSAGLYEHVSHNSHEDIVDDSADSAIISGRLVIERSPIRLTDASPVRTGFPSDELVSENGFGSEVLSPLAEVTSERYCTLTPSLPVERSVSYEKVTAPSGTSQPSRVVYETCGSIRRSRSGDGSQVSLRENANHSTDARLLPTDRSHATYSDGIIDGRSSREFLGTTRNVYVSGESFERSLTHRISPAGRRTESCALSSGRYSSHEAAARTRYQSDGGSRSPQRFYETRKTNSRESPSHGRPQVVSRDRDSLKLRSYSPSRNSDRGCHNDSPFEITRLETPNKRYSSQISFKEMRRCTNSIVSSPEPSSQRQDGYPRGSYNTRQKERSPVTYNSREARRCEPSPPLGSSGSRSNSSAFRYKSPDMTRGNQHYLERRDSRSRISRDHHVPPPVESTYNRSSMEQQYSSDPNCRRSAPESSHMRNRSSFTKLGSSHYSESGDDRSRITRDQHSSSHTSHRRSAAPLASKLGHQVESSRTLKRSSDVKHYYYSKHEDERDENRRNQPFLYDPSCRRSAVSSTFPPGRHIPPPVESSDSPSVLQNYFETKPPAVILPPGPKFNPAIKPLSIPPVPSKYVDVPPAFPSNYRGNVPPHSNLNRRSPADVWSPGPRSLSTSHNPTLTNQNITAEEFIKLCTMNKPMRTAASLPRRRR